MRQLGHQYNLFSQTCSHCCVCTPHFHVSVLIFMTNVVSQQLFFNNKSIKYWVGQVNCFCCSVAHFCLRTQDLDGVASLPEKVDFSLADFTSASKTALSFLSHPLFLTQSLLNVYIYIHICVFYVVLSICPSMSMSGDALQTTASQKIQQRVREPLSSMFTVIPYLKTAGGFYFSGYTFRVLTKNRVSGQGELLRVGRRGLFSSSFAVVFSLILLNQAEIGRTHPADKEKQAVGIKLWLVSKFVARAACHILHPSFL